MAATRIPPTVPEAKLVINMKPSAICNCAIVGVVLCCGIAPKMYSTSATPR